MLLKRQIRHVLVVVVLIRSLLMRVVLRVKFRRNVLYRQFLLIITFLVICILAMMISGRWNLRGKLFKLRIHIRLIMLLLWMEVTIVLMMKDRHKQLKPWIHHMKDKSGYNINH